MLELRRKRRIIQYILPLIVLLCVAGREAIPARAAGMQDRLGIFIAFDSDEEVVLAGPAIGANVDGTVGVFLLASGDTLVDKGVESVYFATAEGNYELQYGGEEECVGHILSVWVADSEKASSDSAFSYAGVPHEGDRVTVVYMNESLETRTMDMMLIGCNEEGILSADDAVPTDIVYPASVYNDREELVAMVLAKDCMWAVEGGADFYAEASQAPQPPQSEEKAPPLPERKEKEPEAAEPETAEPETAKPGFAETAQRQSRRGVIGGALLAAGAAAAVVIAVMRKKGGKSQKGNTQTSYAVTADKQAVSNAAQTSYQTSPQVTPQLWLAAKGGCMNGRVYPIEKNEITIGRDASSLIRYPADTVGVSRIHAKLYWQNGRLMLMDCNSTSGTFLQRSGKLPPMNPTAVQSGDVFYIGEKINGFEIRN